MSQRFRQVIFLLLFFVLAVPQSVFAENGEFYSGVINIERVTRNGDGSADTSFSVSHAFSGTESTVLSIGGHGSRHVDLNSVVSSEFTNLSSTVFTNTSYDGSGTISAEKLDCQEPDDYCSGCVYKSFQGPTRHAGIINRDPSNTQFSVLSRYSVLRGTAGENPAPNFSGATSLSMQVGKETVIDLLPSISYPRAFSCSLRAASYKIGLLENPKVGENELRVTPDCKIIWNTDGTSVGEEYAFQVIVRADDAVNGTSCTPETQIDFAVQIGCADEDLDNGADFCFLCSETDISPIVLALSEQVTALKKKLRTWRRKQINRSYRLYPRGSSAHAERLRLKGRKGMRKAIIDVKGIQSSLTPVQEMTSLQSTCAAPSHIFCDETSNLSFTGSLRDALEKSPFIEENTYKGMFKLFKILKNKTTSLSRAEKKRATITAAMGEIKALAEQIPDSQISCH
ncbi:MAG: hypothetical protein KDD55_06155 [Bdellovibrionales bacterium]|nr:hypothetical protein [Bdellovibrionales bacterium]